MPHKVPSKGSGNWSRGSGKLSEIKKRHGRDVIPVGLDFARRRSPPSPEYDRYVNQVFEGNVVSAPTAKTRDHLGGAFKVVRAPKVLNFRDGLVDLIGFLTRIRRAVLRKDRRIFVDLSPCQSIDVRSCILLAAELHRCQSLAPGHFSGCDPAAHDAVLILRELGFHELLKISGPSSTIKSKWIAAIRAGHGADEEVAPILDEVAELAMTAWGDLAFRSQILAALNEAMTNVIMHAYPPEYAGQRTCVPGAWWAAGIVNQETNEAWFFAFDQGVGLPRTAVRSHEGLLARYELDPNSPEDHLVISAVITEARTQTGLGQHGQGIPQMVRLIEEKAVGGSITIASLHGEHMIVKNPTKDNPMLRRVEFGLKLEAEVPGTLIVWKVDGPMIGSVAEGGA